MLLNIFTEEDIYPHKLSRKASKDIPSTTCAKIDYALLPEDDFAWPADLQWVSLMLSLLKMGP